MKTERRPEFGEAPTDMAARLDRLIIERDGPFYELRLYVTGMTSRSVEAIRTVRALCERHLKERHRLEIIDVHNNPAMVRGEQILAAPTLVRSLPLPIRRIVGGLSDKDRIIEGLEVYVSDEEDQLDSE
jgi:circadian clock protein KaiB